MLNSLGLFFIAGAKDAGGGGWRQPVFLFCVLGKSNDLKPGME